MSDLRDRIVAEIIRDGPMPFSRFMELALYDDDAGALQRRAPGPEGHFVTATHVSSVFIGTLAVAATRARDTVGGDGFTIVDVGAGDGATLAGLAEATGARAIGVDRSAAAREAMTRRGLEVQARTTQRDLLHALGYRRNLDAMRVRQDEARARGDHATEVALWNARGEAAMLVDPQGMGGFGVLVLATAGLPPLVG